MLFKTMAKDQLRFLVDLILETHEVIGPKKVAVNPEGKDIHHYLPVKSWEEIDLEYEKTEYSAKTYFLPFNENLSTFKFEEGDWAQQIEYFDRPRAIIGLRPCDINALNKLDKVFSREFFPSPYYISRRKNTLIIGLDHEPCDDGFCRSMGADTVN